MSASWGSRSQQGFGDRAIARTTTTSTIRSCESWFSASLHVTLLALPSPPPSPLIDIDEEEEDPPVIRNLGSIEWNVERCEPQTTGLFLSSSLPVGFWCNSIRSDPIRSEQSRASSTGSDPSVRNPPTTAPPFAPLYGPGLQLEHHALLSSPSLQAHSHAQAHQPREPRRFRVRIAKVLQRSCGNNALQLACPRIVTPFVTMCTGGSCLRTEGQRAGLEDSRSMSQLRAINMQSRAANKRAQREQGQTDIA